MTIGCGTHRAQIVDRSGATVSHASVLAEVEWTRVLDDVSTARAVVAPDEDCCASISQIRTWRHKLVIWRDEQPVWEGPIVTVSWGLEAVEIRAVDVLGWLERRVPHADAEFAATELTQIAAWLIEDGYQPDDPGHSVEIIAPTRIRGDRVYEQEVGQTHEHLQDLAETGLDYTVIGSRIVLMPEDHCERVGALTDADLPDGLTVTEDGTALATRWVVHGDEDLGVLGEVGGKHPYYGLLEQVAEESSIRDTASALAAARSRLRGSSPAPLFVDSQATLSPEAAVDIQALVPGWCLDVTTTVTCRSISQSLKIASVRVTEDQAGETVSVQLVPSGAGVEGDADTAEVT